MSEETAKQQLKQRILQELQHAASRSARLIASVLETPTFFYTPQASDSLILEWTRYCPGGVIVATRPLGHRLLGKIPGLGIFSDIPHEKHTGYLISYREFSAVSHWSCASSVIFEDVEIEQLREAMDRNALDCFAFKFATTSSSRTFSQFLRTRATWPVLFAPKRIRRSHAKSRASKNLDGHPLFRFQILGDPDIAKNIPANDFIARIEHIGSKVMVTTCSFNDELVASFALTDAVKQPVLMPRIPTMHGPLCLASDGHELCTIVSLNSLVGSRIFFGDGCVVMQDRAMYLYSFSGSRSLKFEIPAEDIEEHVILTITDGLDGALSVTGGHLLMSIALKIPPRVYSTESQNDVASRLAGNKDACDKCTFLNNLEWMRLSSSEFSEFSDGFDLRISMPLVQDIFPTEPTRSPGDDARCLGGTIIRPLVRFLGNYRVKVVCSDLSRNDTCLSLDQIKEHFLGFDFDAYYSVVCLISRKGRLLAGKITRTDLDYISRQHIPSYCEGLDHALRGRFEPFSLHVDYSKASGHRVMVRTAVVTPLRIIFNYEAVSESNRVLRHFDPDKFLRISMREEDGKSRLTANYKNADNVYERFRSLMLGGISIGQRRYFFLAMTASQLKMHGSWFITPYEDRGVLIGADYIKSWLGSFSSIKNIGKYAVRVGLALSSTTSACTVDDFIEIEDIERNAYCFTDGVGLITQRCAGAVSNALGLTHIPSAFQVRFAGYKGVLVTHPWLDDGPGLDDWLLRSGCGIRGYGRYSVKGCPDAVQEGVVDRMKKLGVPDIIFRKSMNKFESSHRVLEIVTISKSCDFYLNRQIIQTLEGLGVPPQVFLDLQDRYVYRVLSELHGDFPGFVKRHCHAPFNASPDFVFFRKLQAPILSEMFSDLSSKSKIFVGQGRGAMGVIDDLGVLEENQVFFMFKKRESEDMSGMIDYGAYAVPSCQCIVAKNPVMHPGDIRVVRCVDSPRLHYLKDVVVFSQRGTRPVFNQCSGSDLDGDIFLLSWCKKLIPKAIFRPYDYKDSSGLVKDRVLLSDIVNFYIRHMRLYQLGQIANSHLATSDKYTIFNERSLKLSEIFNKSIDYVKTGSLASVPDDLKPVEFPDFMENVPSYYSRRALGMLYRRSCLDLSGISFCECTRCILREIRGEPRWKEVVLMGSGAKTREMVGSPYTEDDLCVFKSYKCDLLALADKYGIPSEERLFCYHGEDAALVSKELKSLMRQYLGLLSSYECLRMVEIGKCQRINSIEMLCGDAYKLGSMVKRDVIGDGSSRFIFNARIHLVDHGASYDGDAMLIDETNEHHFYGNRFDAREIAVRANIQSYEGFACMLDTKRRGILGDAFNLIMLSKLHRITEIDKTICLLAEVSSRMVCSDRLEFFRSALPGSDNVLFRIAALSVLDMSVVKKNLLLREKVLPAVHEVPVAFGICKRTCLIVNGMFDGNDDVEFVREGEVFTLSLKNRGMCSPDYYKDTLRDFLVNVLYSGENSRFVSSSKEAKVPAIQHRRWRCIDGCGPNDIVSSSEEECRFVDSILGEIKKLKSPKPAVPRIRYRLLFSPGRLHFTSIPENYLNDCFSIRAIERILDSKDLVSSLGFGFTIGHDGLDSSEDVLSTGKDRVILSLAYGGQRYTIQYSGDRPSLITKGRAMIGKAFIVNGSPKSDLHVEFTRDEIIFNDDVNVLEQSEDFMRYMSLIASAPACYRLGSVQGCTEIELERTTISAENGFALAKQTLYASSRDDDALELKEERVILFAEGEFVIDSIESIDFDKTFSRLWKVYVAMLGTS